MYHSKNNLHLFDNISYHQEQKWLSRLSDLGYGLDSRGTAVRFFVLQNIHTVCGAHTAFNLMATQELSPGSKALRS